MSNVYGKSCTPNLGGVSDFYTKSEVNTLLASKASISQVYSKAYIDDVVLGINQSLASLSTNKVSQSQLNTALEESEAETLATVAALYATKSDTYTKSQVNFLFSTLNITPGDYIRKTPTRLSPNTINPGSNNTPALVLRGSTTNPTVQRWLTSANNTIGYVTNSGNVIYERLMQLGRLMGDGEIALLMSGRRIGQLGTPTEASDAVPLSYLKSYILDFYEEIARGEPPANYVLDGGVY
jgi:hypothetical protein